MTDLGGSSVSAVVVAFNGGTALRDCVASLLDQTIPLEVIVVDNASTDGSVDSLEHAFGDDIRVLRLDTNRGYAAGANVGWHATTADLVAILNQDLVLMPDCLELMREALLACDQEALVTPKLVLKADPTRVNAVGNQVHLSGVAWCRGLGTPANDWHGTVDVTAISGAAFMARVPFLQQLDGLEEGYFMYMEDVDLSLRARIAGAVCVAACDAVAIHDWELVLDARRFELMERNRRALWQRFWRSYPRMYPLLLQAELMAWAYAMGRGSGYVRSKLRAGRTPLRLGQYSPDAPSGLLRVLARRHPYGMLFPRSPLVARLGYVADRIFSAAIGSPLEHSQRYRSP